jgi:hypothetical protein
MNCFEYVNILAHICTSLILIMKFLLLAEKIRISFSQAIFKSEKFSPLSNAFLWQDKILPLVNFSPILERMLLSCQEGFFL